MFWSIHSINAGYSSASSWGCELKCPDTSPSQPPDTSASSWGCELKFYYITIASWRRDGQPLREAVSWNIRCSKCVIIKLSQPLREAVSWNGICVELWIDFLMSASSWGCELKYYPSSTALSSVQSASSWGCELKLKHVPQHLSKEVVSLFVRLWVEMDSSARMPSSSSVSLFVRLWVEIINSFISYPVRPVSLFVRLWVEMLLLWLLRRSGGCQPLREAVSWNALGISDRVHACVSLFVRLWVEIWIIRRKLLRW